MKKVQWFSSSEVTRQLNISLRQLYYWELKGIVRPKVVTMGSREFKRYSIEDVETLRRIKELLDQGYTLSGAMKQAKIKTMQRS
ncbi:MAG: MerR family transcriptional regulator [candidate division KSB1 bacterium]|nr:MerR family transcriptional regulator [candidate division KSB1 bacterium]MDQ7062901.1 MerR family transcriptional regulator [candidate division KSB1 bacterium]